LNKQGNVNICSLTSSEVSSYLEITHPFLMIDKVENIIPGKCATGIKNLSNEDWFFKCHLQREMVMPGTLQIEAMLQTLVLTIYTMEGHKGNYSYITNIKTKLLSKVTIDNQLIINAELLSFRRGISKGIATGKINNKIVCQGEFEFISPHALPKNFHPGK
jgi:3-hydroxyacyl-[acyl-carrier-protein] dehydratase